MGYDMISLFNVDIFRGVCIRSINKEILSCEAVLRWHQSYDTLEIQKRNKSSIQANISDSS